MREKKNTGRVASTNRSQVYADSFPMMSPTDNTGAPSKQRYYPVTNDSPKTGAPKKIKEVPSKSYKPSGTRMKPQPASTSRSM